MTDDEIILIPAKVPNPPKRYMSGANRSGMTAISDVETLRALLSAGGAVQVGAPYAFPRFIDETMRIQRKPRLYDYDKTHCCKCDTPIPPGRAGRMCKVCRSRAENAEQIQALSAGLYIVDETVIYDPESFPVSKQGGDLSPTVQPNPQTGEDDVA